MNPGNSLPWSGESGNLACILHALPRNLSTLARAWPPATTSHRPCWRRHRGAGTARRGSATKTTPPNISKKGQCTGRVVFPFFCLSHKDFLFLHTSVDSGSQGSMTAAGGCRRGNRNPCSLSLTPVLCPSRVLPSRVLKLLRPGSKRQGTSIMFLHISVLCANSRSPRPDPAW